MWQARLTIDGRFFCGGTIIAADTILTAGHCLRQLSTSAPDVTFSPKSVLVCLGTDVNACTQFALGDRMWIHPTYTSAVTLYSQRIDLTVLKLQAPITFSPNIGSIPIASSSNCPTQCESTGWKRERVGVVCVCFFFNLLDFLGASYIVSGFGNQNADTGGSSNPSSTLKYARQTYVSRATCQAAATGFTLPATALCAGPVAGESGTDACQGDVRRLKEKKKREKFQSNLIFFLSCSLEVLWLHL